MFLMFSFRENNTSTYTRHACNWQLFSFSRRFWKIMTALFYMLFTDTQLREYSVNEKEVTKIAAEVAVAKREAEIVSK